MPANEGQQSGTGTSGDSSPSRMLQRIDRLPWPLRRIALDLYLLLTYRPVLESATPQSKHISEPKYSKGDLETVTPAQFEDLVAVFWELGGYDTYPTGAVADEGVDVIAENDDETVAVQAKRFTTGDVGAPTVRRTAGAADQFGADRAAIASATGFTKPAYKAANKLGVELIDGEELVSQLNRAN